MEKAYCYNCDKMVIPKKIKSKNKYKVNGEYVLIDENIFKCSRCDNEIDVPEYDQIQNVYDEYLKMYGLTFDDFKKIRNSYNLSQESFSKILGWSKKTITRYENKESFPQKEYLDTYKKLKDSKEEMVKIMLYNKNRLKDDYYVLLKQMGLYEHIKTLNSFLYMLSNNSLYSTSLMKNMFALDFEHNKIFDKPLTILKYAKAPYGPIIDNHNEVINYLLNNGYFKVITEDDEKFMFESNSDYDINFFNEDEISIMKKVKEKLKGKTPKQLSDWSHKFKGWKSTRLGQIIDYKKYKDDFTLDI